MIYQLYTKNRLLKQEEIIELLEKCLKNFTRKEKLLVFPPDISRLSSGAGLLTRFLYKLSPGNIKKIIPATGTHLDMSKSETAHMFSGVPEKLFEHHDWKKGLFYAGTVPQDFIADRTGLGGFSVPVELNKNIFSSDYTSVISIGQVVPHEVTGMSNHNKNIIIGAGGESIINLSHYISALFGIEKLLGRAANPVRDILDYAENNFLDKINIFYILTVCGYDSRGNYGIKGLFAGTGKECYEKAAAASAAENIFILDKKITKAVVFLDRNIKSLWIGNKAIYRSRLAMDSNSELIIYAPGVNSFGEDPELDRMIRKYGYYGREKTIASVNSNSDLKENLSAAAHLIHGSTENRFKVTWCPGSITEKEVVKAGYSYADPSGLPEKYKPEMLKPGFNISGQDGEEIYFIPDPGQGLWASADHFKEST